MRQKAGTQTTKIKSAKSFVMVHPRKFIPSKYTRYTVVALHCSPYRHFDLNKLWISDKEFTAGVYIIVVEAMQVHVYTGGQLGNGSHHSVLLLVHHAKGVYREEGMQLSPYSQIIRLCIELFLELPTKTPTRNL